LALLLSFTKIKLIPPKDLIFRRIKLLIKTGDKKMKTIHQSQKPSCLRKPTLSVVISFVIIFIGMHSTYALPTLKVDESFPLGENNINACRSYIPLTVPTIEEITLLFEPSEGCPVITVTLEEPESSGDDSNWSITYTYIVSDCAGSDKYTITYSGSDQTAPVFSGTVYNHPVFINACKDNAIAASPEFSINNALKHFSDACDQNLTVTYTDDNILSGNSTDWVLTFRFIVKDHAGNETIGTYTVKGGDRTKPLLTGSPYIFTGFVEGCLSDALIKAPFFSSNYAIIGYTDDCGGSLTAVLKDSTVTGTAKNWFKTFNYDIVDESGNIQSGGSYTINGGDRTDPIFDPINNLIVDGTMADRITLVNNWTNSVRATDACGGIVTITNDLNVANIDWNLCQTINVTFTATDAALNQSTLIRTLQISSIVLTGPENVTYEACIFPTNEAIIQAFQQFMSEFKTENNGCSGTESFSPGTAPISCNGGTTTITFTVSDGLFTKTHKASFTITPCYKTIEDGNWSNSTTWQRGCIPDSVGNIPNKAKLLIVNTIRLYTSFISGAGDLTFLVGDSITGKAGHLTIDKNFTTNGSIDIIVEANSTITIGVQPPDSYNFCTNTGAPYEESLFHVKGSNLKPSLTIKNSASFLIYGNFLVENNFTIKVIQGGELTIKGDFTADNNATVNYTGAGGSIGCNMIFNNKSAMKLIDGTLDVGGDLEFKNGGTIDMENGSTLSVIGMICSGPGQGNSGLTISGDTSNTVNYGSRCFDTVDIDPLIVLPIELLSFNVEIKDDQVIISWLTASELNNDYFTIEHSTNMMDWLVLGHVDGAGTINDLRSYSFTHSNPTSGINYYRLKQTDFDGAFEYFDPVAVQFEATKALDFNVLKNGSQWIVEVPSQDSFHVVVYSLTGRKLYSAEGSHSIQFPNPAATVVIKVVSGTQRVSRVVR
jgi:hypothetical protein